jgi:cytochrome c553
MSNEISNGFGPADWFPEDHPPMPDLVAHGRQDTSTRACALCHMPNGKGRPENAPVGGQPYEYIIQQLNDFRAGLRYSSEPRKENTAEMIHIAKTLSDDDMQTVARYFSAIKWTPWIRVVEADQVPTTRLAGNIFYSLENGETEPIGHRIIEMPENNQQTQLRNPRSGFVAYVPTGSLAKGKALVTTGGDGKTTPCAICHGPELLGIGTIPGIAGRSPSYLTRQIYDIKLGTRHGAMAALMKPVVEHLSDDDVIAVVAYVSSLKP